MLLSVITGTHNRLKHLREMIASAKLAMPRGIDYEFVVVDGHSSDGTREWCEEQPDVVFRSHGELRGAIAAFNDAGKLASGDYLIVANDDILFGRNSISRALSTALDDPGLGAGCFYQDRGGKDWHIEHMGAVINGESRHVPYAQVAIIPRWLWDHCGGWGDFGGRTYGGDNYVSAKIYENGYKIYGIKDAKIHDTTPYDELRRVNNTANRDGELLVKAFPKGFVINTTPRVDNPLPKRKKCLYCPIFETYQVQHEQKKGLREALKKRFVVWEVDYKNGHSFAEAAEIWKPDFALTQFHGSGDFTLKDVSRLRENTKGHMVNWNGDVWPEQQVEDNYLKGLRLFDFVTGVNNDMKSVYEQKGIRFEFLPVSFEPMILP